MIAPMAKIRVLGPSSRLSAVVALFQEIGAIHIESTPSDIRRTPADIPVIRRHVLDPAAQQTRATLETALEKVRQLLLLLVLPSLPEGTEGEELRDLVPEPSGADPLKVINAQLDTLSARAASLVADLKRHQDEQSLFSRYDKVLKVLSPLIGMVRESRELECTGLILSSKEAALATLLEDALSLLRTAGSRSSLPGGGQGYAGRASHFPCGKGRGSANPPLGEKHRRTAPSCLRGGKAAPGGARDHCTQAGRASARDPGDRGKPRRDGPRVAGPAPRSSPLAREPDREDPRVRLVLRDPCDVPVPRLGSGKRAGATREGDRRGVRGIS